jgi:hypothetical protein
LIGEGADHPKIAGQRPMAKPRSRKVPWSRPLADLVGLTIDPLLARQGFGQSDLILFWDDIVGARLATMSQPIKMLWPPRHRGQAGEDGPASATLMVRVETGFALELQHLAPIVVERVNAHLGWRCVSRLMLKQGPIAPRAMTRRINAPPDKSATAAAEKLVGDVTDEPLRRALSRLGARVLGPP